MTEENIKRAFEVALAAMTPALPIVYANMPPPPGFDATKPHQKCWLLPARNRTLGLTRKTTLHKGIFQVNLCYPSGIGTRDIMTRAGALQSYFHAGKTLVAGGVTVRVTAKPSVAAPVGNDPYTVPVSIDYECVN